MSAWASSKFVPGQFTGSTGANILSTKELASGFQAWAKRVSFIVSFFIRSFSMFLQFFFTKMKSFECHIKANYSIFKVSSYK